MKQNHKLTLSSRYRKQVAESQFGVGIIDEVDKEILVLLPRAGELGGLGVSGGSGGRGS